MQTQNIISNVMIGSDATPAVGMGATICMYTDRHAATIVKVTPTQVHVRRDRATRVDSNGMSDAQTYAGLGLAE